MLDFSGATRMGSRPVVIYGELRSQLGTRACDLVPGEVDVAERVAVRARGSTAVTTRA